MEALKSAIYMLEARPTLRMVLQVPPESNLVLLFEWIIYCRKHLFLSTEQFISRNIYFPIGNPVARWLSSTLCKEVPITLHTTTRIHAGAHTPWDGCMSLVPLDITCASFLLEEVHHGLHTYVSRHGPLLHYTLLSRESIPFPQGTYLTLALQVQISSLRLPCLRDPCSLVEDPFLFSRS